MLPTTTRCSRTNRNRSRNVSSLKWIVCLMLWGCSLTAEAWATPMTWAYIGSITGSPDELVLAVGGSVDIRAL
jgi:hypothetical protein